MFEIDEIPAYPDEAIPYLVEILGSNYWGCFDSAGKLSSRSLPELAKVVYAIGYAQQESNFSDSLKEVALGLYDMIHKQGCQRNDVAPFVAKITSICTANQLDQRFNSISTPVFSLEQGDIEKIFELTAEMRDYVSTETVFGEDHKNRILKRISAIEREVRKPKGLFDVVLGGVHDIGVMAGVFGENVKPLVDRFNEIQGIVQKETKEYEKLPEPEKQKRLPPPDTE